MRKHTDKEVQQLARELQDTYPDYTDEHVNEYVGFMREEGYSREQIESFIIACGY